MTLFKAYANKDDRKPTREKAKKTNNKKQSEDNKIENIRNLFRLAKKEAIKDRIIRDVKNLYNPEKDNYYKPVRVNNFYSNNYIEYASNGDRNKTAWIKEYFDEIKPYLKDIINNLKTSDTCKI